MSMQMSTPDTVGLNIDRLARIKPSMQSWIDRGTISGATMIISRRGQIAYSEQIGEIKKNSGVPMESDTIFRIYSMTKPIICTALMMLYEEGRFGLNTPAATFMSMLADLKVLEVEESGNQKEVACKQPITVGDLMKHTAGFTYDFLIDSPVGELYRQAQIGHNGNRTLEECAKILAELPLAYQPDSRWHYSISIDVAAYLLQVLEDKPLGDVLKERIFVPLGMVDTDFCVPDEKLHRLAAMYGVGDLVGVNATVLTQFEAYQQGIHSELDVQKSYPTSSPETFARGGHGLYSTGPDYMKFAQMLANCGKWQGQRLIGRKTLELMHANHLRADQLPWELSGVVNHGYGFGLGSRSMMAPGLAATPGSEGEFGWAGAATTYYWIDPQEEMIGIFMTQYQGADEPDKRFRQLAYQAIDD
ncbi:MAG: serine hydrolase domain-containing protein [Chloroflexota bacterium]